MSKKEDILIQLTSVIDPQSKKNLVELNAIKDIVCDDLGKVFLSLSLPQKALFEQRQFQRKAEMSLRQLSWVKEVSIRLPETPLGTQNKGPEALSKVKNIIAISSCKGGVGKSTIAVNLAFQLSLMGYKTGLFDADVFGPSLPTLVHIDDMDLYMNGSLIQPLVKDGVKLQSFGYTQSTSGERGAAILRGAMVSQVVTQLFTGTEWGDLDYLILDMPPGTGDIPLSLNQSVPITAAIIVSTPQKLSYVDVVKGIQLYHSLNVPMIGLIQNMSYFQDPSGQKHRLFGEGLRDSLVKQYGFKFAYDFPLDPSVSPMSDSGQPLVHSMQGSDIVKGIKTVATAMIKEVSMLDTTTKPAVSFNATEGIVLETPEGQRQIFSASDLRHHCNCALCREAFSGDPLHAKNSIPSTIAPKQIKPMGHYAFSIIWSDGHQSIYPFSRLLALSKS